MGIQQMIHEAFPENYRGFRLGWVPGPHGIKAAWKSSLESEWRIGHIYVDTVSEAVQLARECIDFNYRTEVKEAELGRRLTFDEMAKIGTETE
jgi:hypothetical protein